MSFILDALRKSEHERQRQTGPALVEAAVAAPKPKPNRWAPAAIALLLVNLVAIGVLLLLKSGDEPAATAEPASAPATGGPMSAAPPPAAPAATATTPSPQASVTQALPETPPPALRPASEPRAAPPAGNPLEREMPSYSPAMEQQAAIAAATPPPGPAAVQPTRRGSVVYQSLPEADPVTAYPPPASPGASSAPANMPTADDMAARGGFPEMKLELHVYSNVPEERIVFINGRRYKAGDTTAEGASVEEITRDGVIMSMGGNRFLLPRD